MFKPSSVKKSLVCVCLTAVLAGCATFREQGAGPHLDDPTITTKVKAAIANDPSLNKFNIGVETYHGEVVLRGSVGSQEDVIRAAEVVTRVEGVVSLFNDLAVK